LLPCKTGSLVQKNQILKLSKSRLISKKKFLAVGSRWPIKLLAVYNCYNFLLALLFGNLHISMSGTRSATSF
jgi:hypothetical protein